MSCHNKSSKALCSVLEGAIGAEKAAEALADVTIYTIVHHIPCDQEITQSLRKLAREILSITKSPCNTILAALTYIDRYFIATSRFNEEAPHIQHRLFLSTLITAHKYCSDVAILNKAWLEVCGDMFTAQDVNSMEREFLTVIRYSLVVEDEDTQERWLETIQGLTEEADAYMMVRVSTVDAFGDIFGSLPSTRPGSICSTATSTLERPSAFQREYTGGRAIERSPTRDSRINTPPERPSVVQRTINSDLFRRQSQDKASRATLNRKNTSKTIESYVAESLVWDIPLSSQDESALSRRYTVQEKVSPKETIVKINSDSLGRQKGKTVSTSTKEKALEHNQQQQPDSSQSEKKWKGWKKFWKIFNKKSKVAIQ